MGSQPGARGGGAGPLESALTAYSRMRFSLSSLGYSMLLLWRGRSEVSPGARPPGLSTPAARASPFLAEANTHEAGLVGPVRFHSDEAAEPRALARPRYGAREGPAARPPSRAGLAGGWPRPFGRPGSRLRVRNRASRLTGLGRGPGPRRAPSPARR